MRMLHGQRGGAVLQVAWGGNGGELLRLLQSAFGHGGCTWNQGQGKGPRCGGPRGDTTTGGTLPDGIIPTREWWEVTKDRVATSRARLRYGHEAPRTKRPRTHRNKVMVGQRKQR